MYLQLAHVGVLAFLKIFLNPVDTKQMQYKESGQNLSCIRLVQTNADNN